VQSFGGAPCRALVELCVELLEKLRAELLAKLRAELLAKLRAELLAKLLVEPLVERRVELKALHGAPPKPDLASIRTNTNR